MCGWVAHETRDGISDLAIDSAVYLSTATSMRHWHAPTAAFSSEWDGLSPARAVKLNGHIPTTHFPPGYAAALAATSVVAGSVRGAARLLGIALIGINLGLIGWFTARITGYRSAIV